MGDPRQFKKKYNRPGHPWQAKRIAEERVLVSEYGLKAKRELWKFSTRLKGFASEAKRLIALRTPQAQLEKKQLLERLNKIGLLPAGASLDDVLSLNTKNLLDRRLQTVVFKKGLARTAKQARQYIIHGHVKVGPKTVSAPSAIIPVSMESQVTFAAISTLANPEHPEHTIKSKPKSTIARETAKHDHRGQKGPMRRNRNMQHAGSAKTAPKPAAKESPKPEAATKDLSKPPRESSEAKK
ncbi:30S ribosomal protein S4 [Candidatus Woesearchaeota archaeon]|nr:30S ribosomal protein S4 [Candidatus Woesearchaeota archaeon]